MKEKFLTEVKWYLPLHPKTRAKFNQLQTSGIHVYTGQNVAFIGPNFFYYADHSPIFCDPTDGRAFFFTQNHAM